MKKNKLLTVFLTLALALVPVLALAADALVVPAAAAAPAERLSDEQSRETQEILTRSGKATGVVWSQINLSGQTYGADRVVNVAEFSLADTHLSMEVINCGPTMVSAKNLDVAAKEYTMDNEGQTVLAAVNGDLWMTGVHSGPSVAQKVLKVTRGVLIIDGEIWASQQIDQENLGATNAEKGTPAGNKAAFGVTRENQPLVGSPDIRVSMTVGGKTVRADGLNRLPAQNALIVYNHRVHSANYALDDAYEVELEVAETSAFVAGGTLTATVKNIYPANSAERPAIGERSIVLTARGNKISALKDNFKVGDTVTFQTTLTDRMGRTELWQNVTDAIGGHMQPIIDGKPAVANGDTTAYPTSFVGYKDDGTVALVTVTSANDGSRAGLRFADGFRFCSEMGYNSVFYLDGGGSTTFVTLEKGRYTVRNKCSDGAPRAVINGIAVVWNEEPVCERQGSLDYIRIPVDMSAIPATYLDGALLHELVGSPSAVNLTYDEGERALRMTTAQATNDPYASLELSTLKRASADEYKYLVFKVKTDHPSTTTFMLYYATGKDNGAAAGRTKGFSVKPGTDEWQYITVDMSAVKNWTGNINNIRLDIFESAQTAEGVSMYIGAMVLCKSAEEAAKVKDGWVPEGAISDYLAYLESLKPETEPETAAPTDPETDVPTEPETEPITAAPTDIPTEAPTPEPTEAPTEVPTDPTTDAPKPPDPEGGCASAMGGAVLLVTTAVAMAAAAVLRRSKERN